MAPNSGYLGHGRGLEEGPRTKPILSANFRTIFKLGVRGSIMQRPGELVNSPASGSMLACLLQELHGVGFVCLSS